MKTLKNNNVSTNISISRPFEEESLDYDLFMPWKNSFAGNSFFQWIRDKYDDFENMEVQDDKHIFFFKNESTFAFRIDIDIFNMHPNLLWNYWKDQIKEHGYHLKNSEVLQKEKLNTLRYYLKPSLKIKMENKQLFGNITLEIIKNEAFPKYIMMKCSWYNGFQYENPLSSKALIQMITN